MQSEHLDIIAAKVDEAIELLWDCEITMGQVPLLEQAREQLFVSWVDPHGTVQALSAVSAVLVSRLAEACVDILREVERKVRDIIALQCSFSCKDPKDRKEFLEVANEAYNGLLDDEVYIGARSQLLMAHEKVVKDGFKSNTTLLAERRGGVKRPRRTKRPAAGAESSSQDSVFF